MAAGGFGRENFGDPMGGGGPISVVRALAISGQTVRVVFTEAPLYRTPAGLADAMNPANFAFAIDAGVATTPVAVGTGPAVLAGPARGVGNGGATGERAVDVSVDRPLINQVTYRIIVSLRVTAAIGGSFGMPNFFSFPGVVPLLVTSPGKQVQAGTDIANSPFLGAWKADDSGDIAPQGPFDSFRKRVLRRMVTPLGSWSFLKGYGTIVRLKEVISLSQVTALRTDLRNQLLLEPESQSVSVRADISGNNILTVSANILTKKGAVVNVGFVANPDGSFQVL